MTFVEIKPVRGLSQIAPVLELLKGKKAFVCGGYARYMGSPNKNKKLVKAYDVDIYCEDEETFEELYAHFKSLKMEIRFDNPMAITYMKIKDKENPYYRCPVIQLIKPVEEGAVVAKGSMRHILESFDFTVVRIGVLQKDDGTVMLLADENFLADEEKKYLRILNIHCPISSLMRFMKYGRKGYHTRPAQLAKLFRDWDMRGPEYRNRLLELFREGEEAGELTQEEIDELEALLRID